MAQPKAIHWTFRPKGLRVTWHNPQFSLHLLPQGVKDHKVRPMAVRYTFSLKGAKGPKALP